MSDEPEYEIGSEHFPHDENNASTQKAVLVFLSSKVPSKSAETNIRGYLQRYLMPKLIKASRTEDSDRAIADLQSLVTAMDNLAILSLEDTLNHKPGFVRETNPLRVFRKGASGYDKDRGDSDTIKDGAETIKHAKEIVEKLPDEAFSNKFIKKSWSDVCPHAGENR